MAKSATPSLILLLVMYVCLCACAEEAGHCVCVRVLSALLEVLIRRFPLITNCNIPYLFTTPEVKANLCFYLFAENERGPISCGTLAPGALHLRGLRLGHFPDHSVDSRRVRKETQS